MEPAEWLQKAYDELLELGQAAELEPADAWRAIALMARLTGSPQGPAAPPDLVQRLPSLLKAAGEPDVQLLLDRVADELDAEEDAWGPLLDALLDVDDATGLLRLAGHFATELELARRVAGLVSLRPDRVLSLGAFAEMRLATVHEGAAIHRIWSTIEEAPAHVLADALPDFVQGEGEAHATQPFLFARFRRVRDQIRVSTPRSQRTSTGVSARVRQRGDAPSYAAALGESSATLVQLAWGEVHEIAAPLMSTIDLLVPPSCQLWHSTDDGCALLESSAGRFAWKLERDESPVFLTLTESIGADSLEQALASGSRASGLVILEAERPDENEVAE